MHDSGQRKLTYSFLLRITSESLHATRTTKLYNRIIQQNVRTKSNQRLLRVKPCNHNLIFFNSTYIRTDWEEQSGKDRLPQTACFFMQFFGQQKCQQHCYTTLDGSCFSNSRINKIIKIIKL